MDSINSLRLLATILLLSVVCSPCFAIHCYNCTSYDNIACNDPFRLKDHDLSSFVVECEGNGTFCRKTTSQVYLDSVNQTMRVTRSCGYLLDEKLVISKDDNPNVLKCYRKRGSKGADVQYCACYSDRCNKGNIQHAKYTTILIFILAIFN